MLIINTKMLHRGCSHCKRKYPIISIRKRWGFMPLWFFPIQYQCNTHKWNTSILCDDCLKEFA